MEHTKVPWFLETQGLHRESLIWDGPGRKHSIASAHAIVPEAGGSTEANAEFIVRACNNLDALLEAAETAVPVLLDYLHSLPPGSPAPETRNVLAALRAAVEKVKGV